MSEGKKKPGQGLANVGADRRSGLARGRKVLFRLSSRRAAAARLILDEAGAQRASAREVAACLVDPDIRALARRGSYMIDAGTVDEAIKAQVVSGNCAEPDIQPARS